MQSLRLALVMAALLAGRAARAAEVTPGRLVERVECAADAGQTYALYLPSHYSADRAWPVVFAFDPGARGRVPVERYQAAAEQYGWIVAGSNNSRNGSWQASIQAARTMLDDAGARFHIDERRVYVAGMSGGARVALGVALASNIVAGVIASSAGYPDAKPRKTLPFVLFGTAGTEDFNYLEMRRLDHELTSPHRVAIFEGGHTWLSSDLATEAVEWMELQAIRSGAAARDAGRLENIFAKRLAAMEAAKSEKDRFLALEAIAADFEGLRDVSEYAVRAEALGRDKRVRDALKKERQEEDREQRETDQILAAESRLGVADQHSDALSELRDRWKQLALQAKAPVDSPERRIARRLLRGLSMGLGERVNDPQYRKVVADAAGR